MFYICIYKIRFSSPFFIYIYLKYTHIFKFTAFITISGRGYTCGNQKRTCGVKFPLPL